MSTEQARAPVTSTEQALAPSTSPQQARAPSTSTQQAKHEPTTSRSTKHKPTASAGTKHERRRRRRSWKPEQKRKCTLQDTRPGPHTFEIRLGRAGLQHAIHIYIHTRTHTHTRRKYMKLPKVITCMNWPRLETSPDIF